MKALRVVQAVGACALIMGATGAGAQEGTAVKSILGSIGILPKDKPPIEYRERPPLVVPPKLELRTPVDSRSIESRAPNWPRDPDVLARQAEEKEARTPEDEKLINRPNRGNSLITAEEIRAGTRARRADEGGSQSSRMGYSENNTLVSAGELRRPDERRTGARASMEEPERQSLVEPPTGYRKPVPAPLRSSVEPASSDTSIFSGFRRWIGGSE